jgi:hypothetical protein
MDIFDITSSGADPGFQVRGDALKKNAPSGGRRENFWGISSEKSRFYAKKIKFFPILGGGGARRVRPPPGSTPDHVTYVIKFLSELRQVGGFLRCPPPITLTTTI